VARARIPYSGEIRSGEAWDRLICHEVPTSIGRSIGTPGRIDC
jgi:hypothetical protein